MKIKTYNKYFESNSTNLYSKLEIDSNGLYDIFSSRTIVEISDKDVKKVEVLLKHLVKKPKSIYKFRFYYHSTPDSIAGTESVPCFIINCDSVRCIKIYADDDEYYYVQDDFDTKWNEHRYYYKADTIDGLIQLLDKVIFKNYKRVDPDIDSTRKELIDLIKKADLETLKKIKSLL